MLNLTRKTLRVAGITEDGREYEEETRFFGLIKTVQVWPLMNESDLIGDGVPSDLYIGPNNRFLVWFALHFGVDRSLVVNGELVFP